jgi:mRNA interferase HigB
MHIVTKKTLKNFWLTHADAEKPLRAWFHEAKAVRWRSFRDVKIDYPTADVLPGNRVIFDVKGNPYRLIVKIHYNTGYVYVRFIGTHAEYDRIDAATI